MRQKNEDWQLMIGVTAMSVFFVTLLWLVVLPYFGVVSLSFP